jgi:hypothetical protein
MPEIIYNISNALVPFTFVATIAAVIYLLFGNKSILNRILCIILIGILIIQTIIGYGEETILKMVFGNKIISVFEGMVNPPDADINIVNKYVLLKSIFFTVSRWITPIGLLTVILCLIVTQIKSKTKPILKIAIVAIFALFTINIIIEVLFIIIGIKGHF